MLRLLLIILTLPLLLTILYKVVPPPVTPLMIIRMVEGKPIHKQWVPLAQMGKAVPKAIVAAEDSEFCSHRGFDWEALQKAYDGWKHHKQGAPLKGGSTISQQTAKNVFLWPGRSLLRKGLEAPLTALIEVMWGKPRILEIYLNVAEFGPGIYGVGAASKRYFNTTPAKLTTKQAALLAAILPSPLHWSATKPGPYVRGHAAQIKARSYQMKPLLNCLPGW